MKVWIIVEHDYDCSNVLIGVYASLEAAQADKPGDWRHVRVRTRDSIEVNEWWTLDDRFTLEEHDVVGATSD